MNSGSVVAEQTANRARTLDMRNRADLSALAGETGSGAASLRGGGMVSAGASGATAGQDNASDDLQLPHAEVLNAIYQLLIPLDVEPQHAWGGYYVFDVPKAVQKRKRRPAADDHRPHGAGGAPFLRHAPLEVRR